MRLLFAHHVYILVRTAHVVAFSCEFFKVFPVGSQLGEALSLRGNPFGVVLPLGA